MKICSVDDCSYPVFSKMLCNMHWRAKHGKLKSKPFKIAKFSKKREVLAKTYTKQIKISNAIPNQRCFFCDELIVNETISNHHLLKREGELLINDDLYVPSHNEHHLMFHQMSVHKLCKLEWWDGFLQRLEKKCPEAYRKVMAKFDK